MNRVILASVLTLSLLAGTRADAQEGAVIMTPPQPSPGTQGYPALNLGQLEQDLEAANRGIRNTRTALLATSGLALVGIIVGSTAARHCVLFDTFSQADNLVCTQRGDALLAAGGSIFGLAAIGMITSGIMLGVRKGKRRKINRKIRNLQSARIRWDIESGRLTF